MSATRPRPLISGSPTGSGKGVQKLPRQSRITPEGRQRLSEIAKQRHKESGGRGFSRGLTKPGTPRRKPPRSRVAQLVAQAAREKANAEAIIDVFKDGIHSHQPMHIRLKAAEAWLRIEHEEGKLSLQEDAAAGQERDREELLHVLAEKLTNGHPAMMLRKELEQGGIIEGKLVEE